MSRQKISERQNKSAKTSIFMLRQSFHHQANSRKSCRNITFRIHNQGQHNLCRDKDYFYRDRQNMKEVNSMSRQDVEEQHKKNGNKEILVATKSRVATKTCVATKKLSVATREK